MNGKKAVLAFVLLLAAAAAWSGGASESAGSATRGKYLAGQGVIVPPGEVYVDSYIASIDYRYPEPREAIGVTLYAGHQQVSVSGQEEVIQIGLQAGKRGFEDLPPMNLAFVIDKSGSMSDADKMGWVKEAFEVFIEKVRPIDFVSLVVFDSTAKVIYPSTAMSSRERRLQFRRAAQGIQPGGGTNLRAGLELGYQQVLANFRKEYTNRVLFLTDGIGQSAGILEMAESYKNMGINVSTIGVGRGFDLKLMTELARKGGGSSRFISDRQEMEETFGSELDRMVVPVARNLAMSLEFTLPVEVLATWGYNHSIEGGRIVYSQDTMHHGDYETILVHLRLPPQGATGPRELARFTLDYEDLDGKPRRSGPHALSVELVAMEHPVVGFSDAMVLKSGSMMRFALALQRIGELYYGSRDDINEINQRRDQLWQNKSGEVSYEELSSPEIERLEASVAARMQRAMDLTVEAKKELENARLRLDNDGFDDEIGILDRYIQILGKELRWEEGRVATLRSDREIAAGTAGRSVPEHLAGLFREMTLDLRRKKGGVIAVSGFTRREGGPCRLAELLDEMALVEIGRMDNYRVVERQRLDAVLEEQELALSDLVDTVQAIEVGRVLAANTIVTGTIIEMASTVVIFGRVINVQTGEVESVAQIILPRSPEVDRLLI